MDLEFKPWGKIGRMNRLMTITQKLNGTNGAVGIIQAEPGDFIPENAVGVVDDNHLYIVYAQSRTRIITPNDDNFGFANWVWNNSLKLVVALGPGLHFGEWWGSGIQNGEGLTNGEKRFSLFNSGRFKQEVVNGIMPDLHVVPVLYEGPFNTTAVVLAVETLRVHGSKAVPGFMKPEGVIVYHHGLNEYMKITLDKDEAPKSVESKA